MAGRIRKRGNGTTRFNPSTLGINPGGKKKWLVSFQHLNSGHPALRFNAFIVDYSDDFKSNWERTPAYGRMDPLHAYQNTERTITLSWNVPSYSVQESQENLKKIGKLVSMLYPTYETVGNNASTISSAPMFKVKFNNLISDIDSPDGLVCTIDGFTFSPNLEAGMFDPDGVNLYPKEYKLNCTLFVLHTSALGWSGNKLRNKKNRGFYGTDGESASNRVGTVPTTSGDPKSQIAAAAETGGSDPRTGKAKGDVSEGTATPSISEDQASRLAGKGLSGLQATNAERLLAAQANQRALASFGLKESRFETRARQAAVENEWL